MNKRIKGVISVIHNNRMVLAETNLNSFYEKMKGLEPKINSKITIQNALNKKGVFMFVNDFGSVYMIYYYSNINYVNNVSPSQ